MKRRGFLGALGGLFALGMEKKGLSAQTDPPTPRAPIPNPDNQIKIYPERDGSYTITVRYAASVPDGMITVRGIQ
jgi:hypothetical protein